MLGLRGVAVVLIAAGAAACLDVPDVHPTDSSSDPTAPASGPHDGMVLLPDTPLASSGTVAPADHGGGDDGDMQGKPDKGGDKGGHDAGSSSGGGGAADAGSSGGGTSSGAAPPPIVVPSFWIDAREVASGDYRACVAAGACSAPTCTTPDDHPVACVSHDAAASFCAWKHKRLPRSDEWTAAAAGAAGRPYPWGAAAPSATLLDACGSECAPRSMYPASDGFPQTAPRAKFTQGATPEGVFDLAGNVAEWTSDGNVRGGSWADVDPNAVRASATRTADPKTADPTIGFRCAADR